MQSYLICTLCQKRSNICVVHYCYNDSSLSWSSPTPPFLTTTPQPSESSNSNLPSCPPGQDILTCGFSGAMHAGLLTASAILHRNLFNDLTALTKEVGNVCTETVGTLETEAGSLKDHHWVSFLDDCLVFFYSLRVFWQLFMHVDWTWYGCTIYTFSL